MLNDPAGLLKWWDVLRNIGGKAKTKVSQNHEDSQAVSTSWKTVFLKAWILLVNVNGAVWCTAPSDVLAHDYCLCAQLSTKQVFDCRPDFVLHSCQEGMLLKIAEVHWLGCVKGNRNLHGGSTSPLPCTTRASDEGQLFWGRLPEKAWFSCQQVKAKNLCTFSVC